MRYHALAADYDGTIAHDGRVDDSTLDALRRAKESGRRLILVTGRELEQLLEIFPQIEIFDRVVAENGALLYKPKTKEVRTLAEKPPLEFADELKKRGAERVSIGHVIVATWEPHQDTCLNVIRDMGLELQVIFNKGAVMVLPSGVNKATGLAAALEELSLSPRNVVAVGDAENDHAFLSVCECAVAVKNALPALKDRADWVAPYPRGQGVAELINRLVEDDLKGISSQMKRHCLVIGEDEHGTAVDIDPYGLNLMVCGSSGGGKSTLTTGLLERFKEAGMQFVIMDPEGDYDELTFAVALGTPKSQPTSEALLDVLKNPGDNVSVNMLAVSVDHRPEFFRRLLPGLLELRSRTGHPHWIIVDEVHHMMPAEWKANEQTLPGRMHNMVYITVHPESVSPLIVQTIDAVLVVGDNPAETVRKFCKAAQVNCPNLPDIEKLTRGDAFYWRKTEADGRIVHMHKSRIERKRHSRKYAEGNLGDRSFFFKGPHGKMNLKAQNLMIFLQIADGIDDETWEYHRKAGEYSNWLGDAGVKDKHLQREVADIEQDESISPKESRRKIREAIENRYTLPADVASGKV